MLFQLNFKSWIKTSALLSIIALAPLTSLAQTETAPAANPESAETAKPTSPWKYDLVGNLNLSHTAYDNWAPGGDNALTWALKISGSSQFLDKKNDWSSKGKIEFAQTKIGDEDLRKSADQISLESIYTRLFNVYVNPYAGLTFETQFFKGYDYDGDTKKHVSHFMDPGFATQSIGAGYEPIKTTKTRLGFAIKETFRDPDAAYNDPDIDRVEFDPGLEWVTDYKQSFNKMLLVESQLNMFANFKGADEIDWKWTNQLALQFNKYVQVNYSFELVRDIDLFQDADGDKTAAQIKSILSLGLVYTFL